MVNLRFAVCRVHRKVILIDNLSVIFAVVLAVILLGEKISLVAGAGVALISVGALLVALG